jgi:drug/metabolite transporter (DMT)-like permease
MPSNVILGLVLAVVGVVLLLFGWNQSQSLVDQVAETFTGRFTESTMWYIILGVAALAGGIGLMLAGSRGAR